MQYPLNEDQPARQCHSAAKISRYAETSLHEAEKLLKAF